VSSASAAPQPLIASASASLMGTVRVPGDKSISHRAVMFGALAIGTTRISGLLEGEDVLATAAAMRAYGAQVEQLSAGEWQVNGVGVGGFAEPDHVLDMGNSGTSTRLIMGLAAACPIRSFFTGDASLRRRPMERVMAPLRQMGAEFEARDGGRLPLLVKGRAPLIPIRYTLPVASAQVKSAILLAALNTPGRTTVIEKEATRDHSERMLAGFGARVLVEDIPEGRAISLTGEAELIGQTVIVPGDPSSAGFPMVAAAITPGADVLIENVGQNPTRDGLIRVLQAMGADITLENPRSVGGEPVADVRVRGSALTGIETPPHIAPSMIDEYPILCVAAALARGTTRMTGIAELRVKESDRIAMMEAGLTACGVRVRSGPDWMEVDGRDGDPVPGGATIASQLDHRIAMSFAVLGGRAKAAITIDDASPIATSFPAFLPLMRGLGAQLV
jgi:3-phosphoshikimate 1-carboxyvinyltransferase